jgi:hypothetical protein
MSLDWKKVKKVLDKNHITPLEFFCLDEECAFIKCFLNKNSEFMFIYVPSKHRFPVNNENGEKIYPIEDADETTASDDYSKSSKVPDMETIEEDKSVTSYKELTKKYQKNISLEGNDEPVPRKIKRQIERLKIPFARLSYDIGLQTGKCLCFSFGDDISLFSIKGYEVGKEKIFFYLINLTDFIEKVEDLQDEIGIIREQFYEIINRVSVSNMESISSEVDSYEMIMKGILRKKTEYFKSMSEYQDLYRQIQEKEEEFVKRFKDKISKEQGVRRSTIELESQRQFDSLYKEKKETVKRGIELLKKFHRNLFILEEVSFDNTIMITRVKNNFSLLKETL